ncbi:MAG: glycosyltransferase family 2 protein [Phycisphaerae bacterium]|nr:glycosyltransferase family 2 protein [Phycisphaerae bacterium]
MDWSDFGYTLFMSVYTFLLVVVSIYGLHRYGLVFLYYLHRRKTPRPAGHFTELPRVTVQLPMFNEPLVAERIIRRTCRLDWPREKLQIQVLDDSTDHTPPIARKAVEDARARGFDITYIHREDRTGYKAGALANGLKTATGEFVTVFDADFVPEPDFLKKSIDYFTDPKVAVVQTRWEHINRDDSMLTRAQAIFLDGHFAIEHMARNRSNRFMNFNGTAGTWRRSAIADAGGWHHDTLTEDLDLSYRAQLKGWKFIFLPDLCAPAELPPEMSAFKAQQFRWTKGGAQTSLKLIPKLLLSKMPWKVKLEGFFHLTCYTMHIYMFFLVMLLYPAIVLRSQPGMEASVWRNLFDMSVFTLATLSASVFYVASQVELTGDWRTGVKYLPLMMAVGIGLCISNTKAVLEALFGRKSEFVRTPKYAGQAIDGKGDRKKRKRHWLPYVEFAAGLYMSFCAVVSLGLGYSPMTAPFLIMFAFGFYYVSVLSFIADRRTARSRAAVPATAAEKA